MEIYIANRNIKLTMVYEDTNEKEFIHIEAGSKWTVVSKDQEEISVVYVSIEKQEDGVEVSIDFEKYAILFINEFNRLFEYRITL